MQYLCCGAPHGGKWGYISGLYTILRGKSINPSSVSTDSYERPSILVQPQKLLDRTITIHVRSSAPKVQDAKISKANVLALEGDVSLGRCPCGYLTWARKQVVCTSYNGILGSFCGRCLGDFWAFQACFKGPQLVYRKHRNANARSGTSVPISKS